MYIKYDENGEYGFYNIDIHGEGFCENECIPITKEFYDYLMKYNGEYLIDLDSVVDTVDKENLMERPPSELEINKVPTKEERLKVLEDTMLFLLEGGMM